MSRFQIHFPNVIFKLLHSPSLPNNQAAFKIPQHLNKLDVHNYLSKIYNLNILDVRTMNYAGRRKINKRNGQVFQTAKWKKAIVTLDREFVWPEMPKDEELVALKKLKAIGPEARGKNSMGKKLPDNFKQLTAAKDTDKSKDQNPKESESK
ncbi:hypothetical protein BKA69DRAFT_1078901 [Paraphysoderma sedebokerense]|nr:hypothetical protein BKA69DRAFT_1078901 [Paraphysoderma sedebokerense]